MIIPTRRPGQRKSPGKGLTVVPPKLTFRRAVPADMTAAAAASTVELRDLNAVPTILGMIALVFAAMLLVLPAVRVGRGQLALRRAIGLWISGAGFTFLAAAALILGGPGAEAALFAGVALAVIGALVQNWLGKPDTS